MHITAHAQLSGNVRLRWARYAIWGRPRERDTRTRAGDWVCGISDFDIYSLFRQHISYIDRYIEHAHTSRVSLVTVI